MKRILLAASAMVMLAGITLSAQNIAPFKNNDRVVFVGNSITDGGHYHSDIWLYYMTRFPDMPVTMFNGGIGGDRVVDMTKRFDGDIMAKKPNVLVVTFGMNDTGYFEYNGDQAEKFAEDKYKETYDNYQAMEKRLKGLSGVRVIQMGGSPYDEVSGTQNTPYKGKNAVMQRVGGFQKESAKQNGWEFLDLNAPMVEITKQMYVKDPKFTLCGDDRIHPDNDGHLVMAYLFLKEQGFAGKEVATVSVDASKKKVVTASNAEVNGLQVTRDGLSFDYLAYALPFPIDTLKRGWGSKKSASEAIDVIPFMDEMNRETLQVSGLKNGNYKLYIDGRDIATFSSADLAQGINMATLTNTPQYDQAMTVLLLNEQRWDIERRFRDYIWLQYNFFYDKGLLFANDYRAMDALKAETQNGWAVGRREGYISWMRDEVRDVWEKEMKLLVDTIYKINKPVERKIELVKVK